MTEQEKAEANIYINQYNKKLNKKFDFWDRVFNGIKYVLYSPLAIASNLVSFVFKMAGTITAFGIPYGLYCLWKVFNDLNNGIAFGEIKQTTFVCLFVVFPFIAFLISLIFEKMADYFNFNK